MNGILSLVLMLTICGCSIKTEPPKNALDFRTIMPFGMEGLITIKPPMKFECGIYKENRCCHIFYEVEKVDAKQISIKVFDINGGEVVGKQINKSFQDSHPSYGNLEFCPGLRVQIERIELRGPSSAVLHMLQFNNHAPPSFRLGNERK